jgi:predicted nucleic acid-binding protein
VIELFKHQPKIIKYAKKPVDEVLTDLSSLVNALQLYNESLIEPQHWQEADRLTVGVDSRDISYVALTLQTGGWLWTGDKKLTTHLRVMGFERVLTTDELYQMLYPDTFSA